MKHQPTSRWFLAVALAVAGATIPTTSPLQAQQAPGISPQAMAQISALAAEKRSRTPAQRKIDSNLLYGAKMARGEAIAQGVQRLEVYLPDQTSDGVVVDVRAEVSQDLLDQLTALGALVMDVSAPYENIRMRIDITRIESIAALPQVRHIMPKQEAMTQRIDLSAVAGTTTAAPLQGFERVNRLKTHKIKDRAALIESVRNALTQAGAITNTGSVNSQGDSKHNAALARSTFGVSGAGVKVGVLSDGVTSLALSQGTGDLGPVTVLPGQTGAGDEGTAMLEIIHDLAPNAQLYFATAFTSITSFAQNIRDLRTAGCDIIVDDVGYFAETPFQDGQTVASQTNGGVVIQAVKDVTTAGALYFSSAANSGNKNDNQSGTWEGDYVDGGAAVTAPFGPGDGNFHNFGGQLYDNITVCSSNPISLFWSDPLGGSANDYDIYRLDNTGTTILTASTGVQSGTQDPFEIMTGSGTATGCVGQRIVVLKFAGVGRFLHLDTNRARLGISTPGSTHGHAATSAPYSFGVAATTAQVNGLNPFNAASVIETFSSDGPRHIFFTQTGAAITPGNVSATGGANLFKPDFTAADGVSVTGVGGFPSPFYGTSAAAPHAAAIAALAKSRNPSATQAQLRAALIASAIDIEQAGPDRDSGYGIVMADTAVAQIPPATSSKKADGDFNGDHRSDLTVFRPVDGTFYTQFTSGGTTSLQWGNGNDKPVVGDYNGDGKADVAIFRPADGTWYISYTGGGGASMQWGNGNDKPVPADYDGDGKTDIAIFRPADGTWYIVNSSNGSITALQWGNGNDIPVPGDYDGDGKADIAIFRPADGNWYAHLSSNGATLQLQWGNGNDIPVPGDYDGDGKTDISIFRPADGNWYIHSSQTGATLGMQWGNGNDTPLTGDFDGDGKTDIAIFRPADGKWYVVNSSNGSQTAVQWGNGNDIPILRRR